MKLSLHDQSVLYHELAKLTQSGFGFDKSADLLLQQAPNRAMATFARETAERIRAGQSIACALHQPRLGILALDRAVIEAAERGGVLETGFAYLRDHYASVLRNRRAISARLLYPTVLLHLAIFLPVFPAIILGHSPAAPLRESCLFLAVLYAGFLLCWQGWVLLQRLSTRSTVADCVLSYLPLLGRARRLACLQRFSTVLRISLFAGLRMSEALTAAGAASGSAILTKVGGDLARNAEQGRTLAALLPQIRNLPPPFRRSLASAEVSGSLVEDLQSWSHSFAHELETQMIRLGTALPTGAILLTGVFVGWRLFSFYSNALASQTKFLEGLW